MYTKLVFVCLTTSLFSQIRSHHSVIVKSNGLGFSGIANTVQLCEQKSCSEASFNYDSSSCNGPPNWGQITRCWVTCNNQLNALQSPVMIRTEHTIYNPDLPAIYINNWQKRVPAIVQNMGHASVFDTTSSDLFIVNPPGRHGVYVFSTIHFHTGQRSNPRTGSEHCLNDRYYDMEAHIVFHNSKYGKKEAEEKEDGLVVIAVFIEVEEDRTNYNLFDVIQGIANTYRSTIANSQVCRVKFAKTLDFLMRKYFRAVQKYTKPANQRRIIEGVSPLDVLPYADSMPEPVYKTYFTYRGSITTPPCYQSVKWIIMGCPIKISQEAYRTYSQVQNSDLQQFGAYGSRRSVQRNLDREVERSFPGTCH